MKIDINHKLLKPKLLCLLLILAGIFWRFNGLNWDSNHHLHPDERFLTMVANDIHLPTSLNEYFDQSTSRLNPTNYKYNFFVYGILPITLNKVLATFFNLNNYDKIALLGRFLSAFIDSLNILIIFLLVKKLKRISPVLNIARLEYWSAAVYASLVLPIQLAHFFTVDTFVNTFVLISLFFSLSIKKSVLTKQVLKLVLSAGFFGLAISSKISAFYSLPLILLFLFFDQLKLFFNQKIYFKKIILSLGKIMFATLLFITTTYFVVRLTNPYYFAHPSLLNRAISISFTENITQLKSSTKKESTFPPAIQWKSKTPIIFSLQNIIFFGLGLPAGIILVVGTTSMISQVFKKRDWILFFILLWTMGFLIYHGLQFAQTMRYFLVLYPWFALIIAFGLSKIPSPIAIVSLIFWPMIFTSIYQTPHSRVEASKWIYQNITPGSKILSEHWDDGLPLSGDFGYHGIYQAEQLEVFIPDSEEKIAKIANQLQNADYYILSSNRAWQSIMDYPKEYPLMSQFYKKLFANQIPNYQYVKTFSSFPKLCLPLTKICWRWNDQWAEESFTVYDHPQVLIFKNLGKKQ